jgi:hypothetical protein
LIDQTVNTVPAVIRTMVMAPRLLRKNAPGELVVDPG